MKLRNIIIVAFITMLSIMIAGCGHSQSDRDKCIDSKKYLWNNDKSDNSYEGNEKYWDAVKRC